MADAMQVIHCTTKFGECLKLVMPFHRVINQVTILYGRINGMSVGYWESQVSIQCCVYSSSWDAILLYVYISNKFELEVRR